MLLLLAGCGSSDNGVAGKSAAQILAATRAAATSANSVHLVVSSKIAHGGSLNLDASLAKDQGHAKSSLFGIDLEAIRTGDTIYVKGNQAFAVRLGRALGVKIPADTWLKGPAKGALNQAAALTNITTELPLILAGTGKASKGAKTMIDGQPAITLKQVHKLYNGTLYVATTGQPYPLKLIKNPVKVGLSESGQTSFSAWNDPITVTPPANAVEVSQLEHTKKGH